jgi:hypothetical protein
MIPMGKRGRAIGLAVITATTAIVSCTAIFGLDPPTRAPPEDANTPPGAAADATIDALVDHADASGDGASIGIRCGFPDAQVFCPGGPTSAADASICCAESATAYTCKPRADCQGFVIDCDYDTCPAPRLCCKYMMHTICQGAADKTCAPPGTTAQVCDPNDGGIGCPSTYSCIAEAMINGVPSPYHTCSK